jgi:hypothetical protein
MENVAMEVRFRSAKRHEEGNETWEEDGGGTDDGPFSATSGLKAAMREGKPSMGMARIYTT